VPDVPAPFGLDKFPVPPRIGKMRARCGHHTADAMQAIGENARWSVEDKHAHDLVAVLGNQPGMYAQLDALPERIPRSRHPWPAAGVRYPSGPRGPGAAVRLVSDAAGDDSAKARPLGHADVLASVRAGQRTGRSNWLRILGHPDHPASR
jgi:hypothetical protein